ncbi:MAG: class I SAM-dependent methyltransferase [Thermodesulfobacteriota bacterium]
MNTEYNPEQRFNERAVRYDDEIENIIPGYRALHDLSHNILKISLPKDAHVLIAGSGTGKEAIQYAFENPKWKITGFDIAEQMIRTAEEKVKTYELQDRIEFIHGDIRKVLNREFDGATSILIAHFMPIDEKKEFIKSIELGLKPGGTFILADICKDINSDLYEKFLSVWKSFQLQNREEKDVQEMLSNVRNNLHSITPEDTIALLENNDFKKINHFWRSLLINGFVAEKRFENPD